MVFFYLQKLLTIADLAYREQSSPTKKWTKSLSGKKSTEHPVRKSYNHHIYIAVLGTGVFRHHGGQIEGSPETPRASTALPYWGIWGGNPIRPLSCQDTPVSPTALYVLALVFPVPWTLKYRGYINNPSERKHKKKYHKSL